MKVTVYYQMYEMSRHQALTVIK